MVFITKLRLQIIFLRKHFKSFVTWLTSTMENSFGRNTLWILVLPVLPTKILWWKGAKMGKFWKIGRQNFSRKLICTPSKCFLFVTGCTTAVLYTLPGSYDKTMRCTKKIMLNIFSVWPDISFDNIKMEKITDISFFNRNNRNYKNNISKLHKIFKIVSRLLKTKFGSVFVI